MREAVHDGQRGPVAAEEGERIADRIGHQLRGRLCGFRLEFRDAGVVLRGRTGSYYVKQLAQHAVMRATGLPILGNEIEVS